MPSGYTAATDRATTRATDFAYDVGRVVAVPPHESGDKNQHLVRVQIDPSDPSSAVWAAVAVDAIGDISIPIEGDTVRVGYEKGGRPVVESIRYLQENGQADSRLPRYGPGHRRISHEPTDGHLEIFPDGTVELQPAPEKPLIIGDGEQAMFRHTDFQYQPNETFYKLEFNRVETRLMSQDLLEEYDITSVNQQHKLPLWDEQTFEWVIPKRESEWREPDPRGAQWTIEGTVRFEKIMQGTLCEVALFHRGKDDGPQDGQLVDVVQEHGAVNQSSLTVPYSFTERIADESRLSIHIRSKQGGGLISSDPLTLDGSQQNIQSDDYGSVEMWDDRTPQARMTYCSITR